ncbi:helix-turn-helix transcriptional regulator [Bacillus sp. T3]|uniref:helix-turn-helix transcriptional regulator n=1 Tax=Bacillus sp. T3 TaxID=467262 RepID=UPI002981F896|nr:AraC family transcriptional regulator [Bacillus sp. T3]
MYSIQLLIHDNHEKEIISNWIHEEFQSNSKVVQSLDPTHDLQILVIEISKLLDWVFIHRLKKQNNQLLIFPIINHNLLHTAALTIKLKLPHFFVKPLKKSHFIRNIKQAMLKDHSAKEKNQSSQPIFEYHDFDDNEALQELFLRRLLRGDVTSEQEIIDSKLFSTTNSIPNTVCFIQGFVKDPYREANEGFQAPQVIQECFNKYFSRVDRQVFFVPYRKHLLMLIRVPSVYCSPRFWKEGEDLILTVIQELQDVFGIYLFIGMGSIYSEPQNLHLSYIEAKSARRTPPYNRLVLRYFDETAREPQIKKSIDYIDKHYADEITVTKVAAHINFSPTYFSRLFKKETGRSYVEYVQFIRLQRAIALIRHSDATLEQIAEELGFNTPNYFSNVFKKYVGLTPSEYPGNKRNIILLTTIFLKIWLC